MITLSQLKSQLSIDTDFTEDDTFLSTLIDAAEAHVAQHTGRVLDSETKTEHLDDFPTCDYFSLKSAPFISLTSITYVDADGAAQTWTASPLPYVVVTDEGMPKVYLAYNQTWPTARYQKKSVTVTYLAGYADSGSPLTSTAPAALKQAALMIAASLYDQRENHVIGVSINSVPVSAERLMAPYRLFSV